jgi:hypothetical protein
MPTGIPSGEFGNAHVMSPEPYILPDGIMGGSIGQPTVTLATGGQILVDGLEPGAMGQPTITTPTQYIRPLSITCASNGAYSQPVVELGIEGGDFGIPSIPYACPVPAQPGSISTSGISGGPMGSPEINPSTDGMILPDAITSVGFGEAMIHVEMPGAVVMTTGIPGGVVGSPTVSAGSSMVLPDGVPARVMG